MKEIKFKYYLILNAGREINVCIFTLAEIEQRIFTHNEDVVIAKCQFTGLQDKNGVDIYTDDICNVDGLGASLVSICPFYGVMFTSSPNDSYPAVDSIIEGDTFEVIGSVHENKELLK